MATEKSTFLDFSRRTDALAARLGVDLGDLPDLLGFSRASLFAYRSGKAKISSKAWNRLASAETKAGLDTPLVEKMGDLHQKGLSQEQIIESVLKVDFDQLTEDDDAQFAALLGPRLVGMAVMNSWGMFEAQMRLLLRELKSGKLSADDVSSKASATDKELRAMRYQLRRLIDMLPDE